ncbi:MAG: hypothetical protein C4548_03445 [Desulfobacteraceae bacterium]|jgi:O-antigen ligase/tetratricopeptide (TPR) repeat protein|nr:MAG: hypothetical protein C4548_03445 [Desulfobacteraceae bacterium]
MSISGRAMQKIAFYLFLAALIFSPLAFGTVETWSYLVMGLMISAGALMLTCASRETPFFQVPGLIPLLMVNAFILLQIVPLPATIVKFLSPSTYAVYDGLSVLTGEPGMLSLSIYPRATLMELLRFSCYLIFYVIAVQFLSDRLLLRKTVVVITGFAAVLALFAIIEFVTRSIDYPSPGNKILWIRELSHEGSPMGPYVNRNHYAGLMEMIFPLVLAMFLVYRPVMAKISIKRRLADFFSHKRVSQHFLYGTAAVLIATSILLSLSRGGILSLTISMIIFSGLLIFRTNRKTSGCYIGVIVIVVLLLTGTSGWNSIVDRFEDLRGPAGEINLNRFVYWKDAANIIGDFPLTGAGVGTFEKIYPLYRTDPGTQVLEHAHNDYLEFLSTGGIILTALMGWALFSILSAAAKTFMKRREPYSVLLFIGCITSVSAVLLHSLVDFNMQVGANGLYFFLVLAMAVAAANTRMRSDTAATCLVPSKIRPYPTGIAALILFAAVLYVHGGALTAHHYMEDYQNITLSPATSRETLLEIHQASKTAGALDMLHPRYADISANTASFLLKNDKAMRYHEKTLRRDPCNSRYLMDAAAFMRRQGNHDPAEKLFLKSIHYNPNNMPAYLKLAEMWFEIDRPEKGMDILKRAMTVDARITNACLALMVLYQFDDDGMRRALPNRVRPHLFLGDFYNFLGEKQNAENAYASALEFLPYENRVEKRSFLHVVNFYRRHHMDEKALRIILKAIDYFPDDSDLHRAAGDLYKKLGIDHRSEERYRKAELLK